MKTQKRQYGRCMRHKDVTRCAIGAFGLYLLHRFHVSHEMDDGTRPDFRSNSSWFDIKILTDGTHKNREKEMQKTSYVTMIRKILKKLRIYSAHFGHWGRVNAPVELEFAELDPELIRILGKWIVVLLFASSFFLSQLPCCS